MTDLILSLDPGKHTGWSIIRNDKTRTLIDYGLIKFESYTNYEQSLEAVIGKYPIGKFLLEEPTFKGFGLNTYAVLRDIYAICRLVCERHGHDNVNVIKIHELKRLYKGLKRSIKKERGRQYVKAKYKVDIPDNNITDSIINANYWLDNTNLILQRREAMKQRKRIIRKYKRQLLL